MGGVKKAGFTIIETMLFLGITGLLIVALLAGTGSSIAVQRYHDSVTSLESTIQNLYNQTADVVNDRQSTESCPVSPNPSAAVPLGQSDCVILGQYMAINGSAVAISSVLGYNNSPATTGTTDSDIKNLQKYTLSLLSTSTATSTINWGAQIAWPIKGDGHKSPTTPRSISILVLRSPQSGRTYTFTADGVTSKLHDMIIAGNSIPGQEQRRLCVDSGSGFNGGIAIFISGAASSSNDIQTRTNDQGDSSTC